MVVSTVQKIGKVILRAIWYILVTSFGTPALAVGVLLWAMPALILLEYLGVGFRSQWYSLIVILGLGLYMSQIVARHYPELVQGDTAAETDTSMIESFAFSLVYFSAVVFVGTLGGLAVASVTSAAVGVAFAFSVGVVDFELARHVDVSPLTLIVAMMYSLGGFYGWWGTVDTTEKGHSRWIAQTTLGWLNRILRTFDRGIGRSPRPF